MIDLGLSLQSDFMKPNLNNSAASKSNNLSDSKSRSTDRKFSDELNSSAPSGNISDSRNDSRDIQERVTEKNVKESRPREPEQKINEKKLATRQAAMEVFLDQMQAELGVPPEDVMGAFSALSMSEMIAPPEESANAVIAKLNLSEQDSKKALGLYNEMLSMTAAAGMAQYLNQSGQEADFQVLNKQEANLQQLRSSINDMSDKFFVTGSHASPNTGVDQQAKIARTYAAQMERSQPQVENDSLAAPIENMSASKLDITGMSPLSTEDLAPMNLDNSVLPTQIEPQPATPPKTVLETIQDMSAESIEAKNLDTIGADALSPNLTSPTSAGLDAQSSAVNVAEVGHTIAAAGESEFSADMTTDDDQNLSEDGQPITSSTTEIHKSNIEKSFSLNAPKATPADVQTNVKEIISQAQFLAKKGGGEMKVALNPNGLGEVSLKVKMVDGQVNVQMVTSSNEAKKILESGLSELKENLAAHKLHLDTIRIDSNKDISQHMDQQQKDMDHGFQQKFLNDFHDRNSNFRREMYEFGAPSVPRSQVRDSGDTAQYDPSRKRRPDESRRLDLVA